jgi:hypothetical protein
MEGDVFRHFRGRCVGGFLAVVVVGVLGVGGGWALGASSNAVIRACANKKTGALRLANACHTKTERAVSWNQQGAPGPQGVQGVPGLPGAKGDTGPVGPYPGTLPSGITLRGNYDLRFKAANAGDFLANSISFGFQFASAPTINYVPFGTTASGPCAGGTPSNPQAAPGNICFFASQAPSNEFNPGSFDQATPFGAKVEIEAVSTGDTVDFGTWAATSP